MPDITLPLNGEEPYGDKLRTAINLINDAVDGLLTIKSVKADFGAIGDGIADDTEAFAAAALDPAPTYVPPGRYVISEQVEVPVSSNGKVFFSDAPEGIDSSSASRVGAVILTNVTGEDESGDPGSGAFLFKCSMGKLYGLSFKHTGTAREAGAFAVRADREDTGENTDDIDISISRCAFLDYGVALRINGRGILFTDNLIANCEIGVRASFPETGTEGLPIQSDVLYAWRANRLHSNRVHSVRTFVETTGTGHMMGALITDNDLDIGDIIFNGALKHSVISNNICRFKSGTLGAINITSGGDYVQLTGNQLGGGSTGSDIATALVGTYGIQVSSSADTVGLSITGNTIEGFSSTGIIVNSKLVDSVISGNVVSRIGQHGIALAGGSEGCTVTANTIRNYGVTADGVNRGGIVLTNQSHSFLTITGNVLRTDPSNANARNVTVGGATLTRVKMSVNQYLDTSESVIFGSYTDGGNNSLES